MKLSKLNKLINQVWINPTEKNIKIGSIIWYLKNDPYYCIVKKIDNGVWGYYHQNFKNINKKKSVLCRIDIKEVYKVMK